MLRYDSKVKKVTDHRELTDTQLRIVSWGEDLDGEIYAVDHQGGGLHRIVPAPPPAADLPKFPRKLSETGLFASTKDHAPAPGVIPYSVNAELWSDGGVKDRFMAIPSDAKIDYDAMTYPQPAPGALPGWRFPNGTVMVKTFSLDLEPGNSKSRRRLETRLLVGERVAGSEEVGDQVWLGTYYGTTTRPCGADRAKGRQGLRGQGPEAGGARAGLAFSEPDRMYALPHDVRQVCPRGQHAAGEP